MNIKYCIQCGREVLVTETQTGPIHTETIFNYDSLFPEYDVIVCDGAFTDCAPPQFELEPIEEPDYLSMVISDAYARILLEEMEL